MDGPLKPFIVMKDEMLPDMNQIQKNCVYAFSGASTRQLREERFDARRERLPCPQRIFQFLESAAKRFNAEIYHNMIAWPKRLPKENMIEASMGPTVGLATVVLFVAAARKGVEPALNLATEKESKHSF